MCGNRQTLLHVLNGCEWALHLHRYNQRHHSVLSVIAELAQEHLPENHQLTTHLGDSYEFSTNIIASTLRPDMVQRERRRTKYLVELTVCYWFQKRQQGERKQSTKNSLRRLGASTMSQTSSQYRLGVGERESSQQLQQGGGTS